MSIYDSTGVQAFVVLKDSAAFDGAEKEHVALSLTNVLSAPYPYTTKWYDVEHQPRYRLVELNVQGSSDELGRVTWLYKWRVVRDRDITDLLHRAGLSLAECALRNFQIMRRDPSAALPMPFSEIPNVKDAWLSGDAKGAILRRLYEDGSESVEGLLWTGTGARTPPIMHALGYTCGVARECLWTDARIQMSCVLRELWSLKSAYEWRPPLEWLPPDDGTAAGLVWDPETVLCEVLL